jgi:hypothetical protein
MWRCSYSADGRSASSCRSIAPQSAAPSLCNAIAARQWLSQLQPHAMHCAAWRCNLRADVRPTVHLRLRSKPGITPQCDGARSSSLMRRAAVCGVAPTVASAWRRLLRWSSAHASRHQLFSRHFQWCCAMAAALGLLRHVRAVASELGLGVSSSDTVIGMAQRTARRLWAALPCCGNRSAATVLVGVARRADSLAVRAVLTSCRMPRGGGNGVTTQTVAQWRRRALMPIGLCLTFGLTFGLRCTVRTPRTSD